jgi:PPOX class probable F420-dependent enzyme
MAQLPDAAREKLEAPNVAYLADLMEDGSPHVSPVWVDIEDNTILFNSAEGRLKVRNIRRDPRVALSVADKENPYDKVDIRGRVVEIVEGQPALDQIDKLAMKYMGQEKYPYLQPGEQRLMFRIEPTVVHVGP